MATIDVEALLKPVGADDTAGPDLEYDRDFLAIFQAAEGTPERAMGNSVVAAEEPDWRQIQKLAVALLERSKDLRIAVLLARASLKTSGLAGLSQGLGLLRGLIDQHWDHLHPQLDPDDDNDPTGRINVIMELCSRDALLEPLRETPMFRSRLFGPLAYREVEIAEGRAPAPAGTKPMDAAALNGAFQDCDIDELAAASAAASAALAEARGLDTALAGHLRTDQMPDLDPLIKPVAAIATLLGGRLAERRPPDEATEAADGTEAATPADGGGAAAKPRAAGGLSGEISGRDDVVRALDRICDYYSRYEPSSPVPLLLKRARKLATGSFVDILRDLAPDAIAQIEKICGSDSTS